MAATQLEKRALGATGLMVSPLGLGTVKFGRNTGVKYPGGNGFELPSDAQILALLDACIEHGVNVLDTAPAYGTSEERLGKLMGQLLGNRRDDFVIVSKTGEEFDGENSTYIFTKDHTQMSVERSLKRLNVDAIDCMLIHSNRDDINVLTQTDVVETLIKLKEKGDIKSIGFSGYTVEAGLKALELLDVVMVTYNRDEQDQLPVIEAAKQQNKGVLIKKGLASGHLASGHAADPTESLRFVNDVEGVSSIIVGTTKVENLVGNIGAMSNSV